MIERLYVHNYRCFENVTLELKGQASTLVIGKNGAGKSTLGAAIGVLRGICRGPNRVKEWIERADFAQNRTDLPMRFEVDAHLSDRHYKYGIAFELPKGFREARVAEERLSVDGQVVFSRELARTDVARGGTFGLDWHVAALPIINAVHDTGLVEQFRAYLGSMILLAPIPRDMSDLMETESVELRQDAGNFASWLGTRMLGQTNAIARINEYLQFAMPDFLSFDFTRPTDRARRLYVTFSAAPDVDRPQLPLFFSGLSDGEKCFFLSAALAAFNSADRPCFCLWDEPDAHLSLSEVSHFVTHLRKMTNQGGQFIATSHHPETIRSFSEENTLVFVRNSHVEPTVVRTLAEFPVQGDVIDAMIRGEVIG